MKIDELTNTLKSIANSIRMIGVCDDASIAAHVEHVVICLSNIFLRF
jgi:hypothetical protein